MSNLADPAPTYVEARRAHDRAQALRELADFIERTPEFADAVDRTRFGIYARDAEEFAALAARLGGRRKKDADDEWFTVARSFGPVTVEVFSHRATVCERVVVGHETVVESAVCCVHCGEPIGLHGEHWWHLDAEVGRYARCGTEIDEDGNEVGGQPATPPSLMGATVEREVVEWRCASVLAGHEVEAF